MMEERLTVPFQTRVLGVVATVAEVELPEDGRIAAVCERGRSRQLISVLDLPLPTPPPRGAEWIDAYRHWMQ